MYVCREETGERGVMVKNEVEVEELNNIWLDNLNLLQLIPIYRREGRRRRREGISKDERYNFPSNTQPLK